MDAQPLPPKAHHTVSKVADPIRLTLQGAGAAGGAGKVCCGRLESEGAALAAAGADASGASAAAPAARARRATAAGRGAAQHARARGSAAATRGRGEVGGEAHGGGGAAAPSILILTTAHGPLPLTTASHIVRRGIPVAPLAPPYYPAAPLAPPYYPPLHAYSRHEHARPNPRPGRLWTTAAGTRRSGRRRWVTRSTHALGLCARHGG
jgi:hypothetical protein